MPRKNKRLEEALARVDAAIADAQNRYHEAELQWRQAAAKLEAVQQTRTFLVTGGQPHE